MGSRIAVNRATSLIVVIAFGSVGSSCAEKGKTMDSATAYKLVNDWARAEREDTHGISRLPNGDFYGKAATLGFQFDNATQNLVVRGQILPDTASLAKYKDIMQELERIARDEPERVSHAQFDLVLTPWNTGDDNPTLYLRRDYKTVAESDARLFEQWRKLRETAYLWHRTYYREAVDPVVQRRLNRR
jgi:hypothetical protein